MATVLGSRPVLNVDADPNTIPGLEIQSALESQFATDVTTGLVYKYDPTRTEGTRWVVYDTRPYKVYTAPFTQSDTGAPVAASVYENTLGANISFVRSDSGEYYINADAPVFTEFKTVAFFVNELSSTNMRVYFEANNQLVILSSGDNNQGTLEIRVYP
jgi:hypothetical protein